MQSWEIMKHFCIPVRNKLESIYPYSPVYRVNYSGEVVVVKKTQKPFEQAKGIASYTKYLKRNGILVVTTVEMEVDNPQKIGEDCYIVYPFIEGRKYQGTNQEIYEAGELLGKIHACSPVEDTYDLTTYNVYDFTKEEVEDSIQTIAENSLPDGIYRKIPLLEEKLLRSLTNQIYLQQLNLPHVLTPHDYKANNLVYTPAPYLIDPDNAAKVPRIFDLALALMLFHNELDTVPESIFTPEQWAIFLSGYNRHIQLSKIEKQYWKAALEHVFLDEVMWLMAEFQEDWQNPAQRKLYESIFKLFFDSKEYQLNS